MKVSIDYDLCMGDGNCVKACPEVFAYDDDKLIGIVKKPGVEPAQEEAVRKAAAECAVSAVIIEE